MPPHWGGSYREGGVTGPDPVGPKADHMDRTDRQNQHSTIDDVLRILMREAVREAVREALPEVLKDLVSMGVVPRPVVGGDAFLTVAEVSKLLRLPPSTVYDLIRRATSLASGREGPCACPGQRWIGGCKKEACR